MNPIIVGAQLQGNPIISGTTNEFHYLQGHRDISHRDDKFGVVQNGRYIVQLTNETFDSVENKPQYNDKSKVKFSNLPQEQAKVNMGLKHQYDKEIGAIAHGKANKYNGTSHHSNPNSPLGKQGAAVTDVFIHALRGFEVKGVKDISVFIGDSDIETVEPVPINFLQYQYHSNNGVRIGQYNIPVSTGFRPDGIEGTTPNVDIAVIDGRVMSTHPDLNLQSPVTCFVTSAKCLPQFHGNMVAGIVAGKDNLGGIVGVVPGARIWSLVTCEAGVNACPGSVTSAFNYVTSNANIFEVATMSVGRSVGESTSAERTAISNAQAAGVTVTVAAGNDAHNSDNTAYCDTTAICVSAMGELDGKCGGLAGTFGSQRDDARAYFSNYGSTVDIMAPGTNNILGSKSASNVDAVNIGGTIHHFGVISAANQAWPFIGATEHGSYDVFGGTSEATPWVAGAAAALKILHPSWTPAQIKSDLQANAISQTAPCNTTTGLGGLVTGANSLSSEKILNLQAID